MIYFDRWHILLQGGCLATKELRINKQIRAREVFVIDADGVQRGNMSVFDAVNLAQEEGLDLVEVSPNANPPVCKILDFGKYRYEMDKKQREAKKNQTVIKLKEVRMQVKVDIGDMKTKCRFIKEFLDEGNKVKVSIRFRGREMQHTEIGRDVLAKILEMLNENGVAYVLEKPPTMEGRMMSIMLAPSKSGAKNAKPVEKQSAEETQ